MRHAGEAAQRGAHRLDLHASRQARGRRRHRVLAVVRPAQAQVAAVHQRRAAPRQPPVALGEVGLRPRPERHPPGLAAQRQRPQLQRGDRGRVHGLAGEELELRAPVGLEGAVAVEMVLGEVEQHPGLGREGLRVLELEGGGLADDGRRGVERPGQPRERGAHVARDHHRQAGGPMHVPDQLDGGRLAVRSGDRHELIAQ